MSSGRKTKLKEGAVSAKKPKMSGETKGNVPPKKPVRPVKPPKKK